MVMPRMPDPDGFGPKLHVPPLQAHRFRLKIERGAEVEELVPDVAKQFGVTEEEARVYLKQLQSERAQVGGGPGRLQSQQGHPPNSPDPKGRLNKFGDFIPDPPPSSIPTALDKLQLRVQQLVDTDGKAGDVVRILRDIEALRNDIETGPTSTKATSVRGLEYPGSGGLAQDDANPRANVSRQEEIPTLLNRLEEIEDKVLVGRTAREAVAYWGQSPRPKAQHDLPAKEPIRDLIRERSERVRPSGEGTVIGDMTEDEVMDFVVGPPRHYGPHDLKAGTPLEPASDISGLKGEFYEAPGLLNEAKTASNGRQSTTANFPVLTVSLPEYGPDGKLTVGQPRMLAGDIYLPEPMRPDPLGPMIVMGDKRYLLDTETGTFRLLDENEYNQIAPDYSPRPSGTSSTTQAVLNQNAINNTSTKDLANTPRLPGKPRENRPTIDDPDAFKYQNIPDVLTNGISSESVGKPLLPTPGFLPGGRRALTNDQARAAASALTEFFRGRGLSEDRAAAVMEALGGLDELINADETLRLSDLGAVDVENIPLDQLQSILREAEGKRYGVDTFALPAADKSERHLLQAQVEEATRYRDEVKNQLLANGEPLSRRELVDAEAEVVELRKALADLSDRPAGMPPLLAEEFNNVIGEYGRAGVDGYMQVRQNLQDRLAAAEARGTQTQVLGGSIAGRNDDAAQVRQALEYMDSKLEPELRGYARGRFVRRTEDIGNSTSEVGKRLGELRKSGVDMSVQQLQKLKLQVEKMDNVLERLNIAQSKLPEGDPRRQQFQAGIEQIQEARRSLDQQLATSSLAGTTRLTNQTAEYPEGALRVLNRYFMEHTENSDVFRDLAKNPEFTTPTRGFDLPDGAKVGLPEMLDIAEQIEDAGPSLSEGNFNTPGTKSNPFYIPEDQRFAFAVEEIDPTVAPQASQGTMAGIKAMRDYLTSKNARTPLWTKDRIAESTNSGLPSQRVLERAEELEDLINDPSTEDSARDQARRELKKILKRERRDVGGERSASEQLAAEQMEFEMGGEGKNPGTLDSGFFYTADTELPAINEMLRAMKSSRLPSDPKLLALRQAASEVGGIEELYTRGYLRMHDGPGVENEYASLADAARRKQQEAERLRVVLERAAETYGVGPNRSVEELLRRAENAGNDRSPSQLLPGFGGPGVRGRMGAMFDPAHREIIAQRILRTQEEINNLESSAAALRKDADELLNKTAPGLTDYIREQVGNLGAEPSVRRSLEQQIAAIDKELSLNPSREHTKDLLEKRKALEFRLRQEQGAEKRSDWERFLQDSGVGELDPVKDNTLLRVMHGMHEAGNLKPGMQPRQGEYINRTETGLNDRTIAAFDPDMLPQIEYLIRTSGSDPAKQEAVLKYIKKNTETKPVEVSSNPDLFAENYNADPANYEEISGAEMDSILEEIKGMQDRYQWAENTLLELDADGMDFDESRLNASDRRRFQEAQAFTTDYDDDMSNLEGQLETAAKNYAPQWTQVRADMSSLKAGDFDPATAQEVTGRPFYAAGGAANEAALFGAAANRFRRSDFLSDNSGLGGRTLEEIRAATNEAESQLRSTLGLDLSDDTPIIEHATTRFNALDRQIREAQTGRGNIGAVAKAFQEKDNLAAQIKAYQDAQKTLAAVEGEEFSVIEPRVRTFETDPDTGAGVAIIEVPDTVSSVEAGRGPAKLVYTLKVPISFADDFRGDLTGRRIEMSPADGGGFEGTLTELRNGKRGDVDWATGEQRAKRFRTRMGERQKLHLRNIGEAAKAQRAARTQPPPVEPSTLNRDEFMGKKSQPVDEAVKDEATPEMKLDGPGRIRKALGHGNTIMKIGGGVTTGGALAAWAWDQMNKPAPPARTEEEIAEDNRRTRQLLQEARGTPQPQTGAPSDRNKKRLSPDQLLERLGK